MYTKDDIQIDVNGLGYQQVSFKGDDRVWATIYEDGTTPNLVLHITLTMDTDGLMLRIKTPNPIKKLLDFMNLLLPKPSGESEVVIKMPQYRVRLDNGGKIVVEQIKE